MPVIRMTEGLARKARQLVKKECCNYDNGTCIVLDCPCPQLITRSLNCKWFRDYVLPGDTALYVEITGDMGKKKPCAACGQPFTPTGSRSVYCTQCAEKIRREKAAERKRRQRLNVTV